MSAGWSAIDTAVAKARALIADHAPDEKTLAEGEAYVARVMAAQLSSALLSHHYTESGFGRAIPTHGCPNPDYRMLHAGVSHQAEYRVSGRLNGSERVGVGLYRFDETGTAFEVDYAAFDAGNCATDGTFEVALSGDADTPDALTITPETRVVLVRILHLDPASPVADLSIEGPTAPPGMTLMTGTNDGALSFAAGNMLKTIEQFMEWTRVTSAKPNSLNPAPDHMAAAVQGDPDTAYFLGHFDLADGESLEVEMPRDMPGYWSLHAYNHWTEHLCTPGAHHRNIKSDDDGIIRIAIGPETPSACPNSIDTMGRTKGILICRIIGAPGIAAPRARITTLEKEA